MAKYRGLIEVKILHRLNGHVLVQALESCVGIKKGETWLTRKENVEGKEAPKQ